MRCLFACLFVLSTALISGAQKTDIYVVDSTEDTTSYDVPGRAICLPGSYGVMCGARGAETAYVHSIRMKARIGDSGVWLTCQILQKKDLKHCGKLIAEKAYPAEPKGNDKVIVYAWANPMYHGDMSKATKLEFHISPRPLGKLCSSSLIHSEIG